METAGTISGRPAETSAAARIETPPWWSRPAAYEAVSIIIALVLLVAAGLKAAQVLSPTYLGTRWDTTQAIAAIVSEWFVGGWLLSGLAQHRARWAAIGLLLILFAVSIRRLAAGEPDCGCFGQVRTNPSWTASFDAIAIVLVSSIGRGGTTGATVRHRPRAHALRPVAAASVIAGSVLAVGASVPWATKSGLHCAQPIWDFGDISMDQAAPLLHDFVVEYRGRQPARIVRVLASCGCTSATASKISLSDRDVLQVRAVVNWVGRRGPQSAQITVVTDQEPPFPLEVTGSLTAPITIWPPVLDFGTSPPGVSKPLTFKVMPGTESDRLRIVDVTTSYPGIIVTRSGPAVEATADVPARFQVQMAVPRIAGVATGTVLIQTSADAKLRALRLRVRSTGAIVATPQSLSFPVAGREAATLRVHHYTVDKHAGITAGFAHGPAASPFDVRLGACIPDPTGVSCAIQISCHPTGTASFAVLRLSSGQDSLEVPLVAAPVTIHEGG